MARIFLPHFHEWGCEFFVDYDGSRITRENVLQLARVAFDFEGLGHWRPGHRMAGPYGRAKVVDNIDRLKKQYRKPQRSL